MTEELQTLLDKIQKDGVDKAESDAGKIISEAKAKAKQIVSDAEKKAQTSLEDAERDAAAFEDRAKKSLKQTARDVVISVEESIYTTLKSFVQKETSGALSPDTLKTLLATVVEAYCKDSAGSPIEVLVSPDNQKEITKFFTDKFAEEMKNGLEVKSDSTVISGFKVSLVNDKIQHDFSGEAITDALCQLLRPHLAEIMRSSQKK
jgi:V/A-type H+-transporting ATPase subunit E